MRVVGEVRQSIEIRKDVMSIVIIQSISILISIGCCSFTYATPLIISLIVINIIYSLTTV